MNLEVHAAQVPTAIYSGHILVIRMDHIAHTSLLFESAAVVGAATLGGYLLGHEKVQELLKKGAYEVQTHVKNGAEAVRNAPQAVEKLHNAHMQWHKDNMNKAVPAMNKVGSVLGTVGKIAGIVPSMIVGGAMRHHQNESIMRNRETQLRNSIFGWDLNHR